VVEFHSLAPNSKFSVPPTQKCQASKQRDSSLLPLIFINLILSLGKNETFSFFSSWVNKKRSHDFILFYWLFSGGLCEVGIKGKMKSFLHISVE
jgi:hypothetical protein